MSSVNPFSYNSGDVSSYNYKRLDPSPFWNPPYSFARKKKKSKFVNKDENIKKIVRNVKSLPEHLIGRFKHNRENSKKSKVETHPQPRSQKIFHLETSVFDEFPCFRTLLTLAAEVTALLSAPSPGG